MAPVSRAVAALRGVDPGLAAAHQVAARAPVTAEADLPEAVEVHLVEAAAVGPQDQDRVAVRVQVTAEAQAGEIMARTEEKREYLTVYKHKEE